MAVKKKPANKKTSNKTAKRKIKEIFEVGKGKKEKIVKKEGVEEVEVSTKNQSKRQEKLLKTILIVIGVIILLTIGSFIYLKTLRSSNYEGIEFKTANLGTTNAPLIMYETLTLAPSNDGTEDPFGFRIRTKPSSLKKIPFEEENFELMKINGYWYEADFNCDGDATIAMENLKRLFYKTGMDFFRDNASTCDSEGRYNYFTLKYGEKTEIKEIGNRCYDIIIKGNDDSCEILPATEKLMVEIFSRYLEI